LVLGLCAASVALLLLPDLAIAADPNNWVNDGEGSGSSKGAGWLVLFIVVLASAWGLATGTARTRVYISLVVGIPLLLAIFVDHLWIIAMVPMVVLGLFVLDPVLKFLELDKDK